MSRSRKHTSSSSFKKLRILLVPGMLVCLLIFSFAQKTTSTPKPPIVLYPSVIRPGEPLFITVNATSTPTEILFDGKKVSIFRYDDIPHAVMGIDFAEKVLVHNVRVKLVDGRVLEKEVTITPREKIERSLGIPEKLGGNTPQSGKNLVSNLGKENAVLNGVRSTTTQLWSEAFRLPLEKIFVTDDYGYDRKTVGQTIVHKGTDFRAATGTQVYAMNDGRVALARTFTVYGNTVIVDHGQGIQTLYMHLSDIAVKTGSMVTRGDVIGHSGMTGYAEAPHLHVSLKVGGVSIDPMVWMEFWEE